MNVRAARDTDLDQIAAIYAHYVVHSVATFEEEAPPVSSWRTRLSTLAELRLPFLVAEAEADGTVCGYAYAGPWRPRPAYRYSVEDSVYVAPGHGGRGIGSALLGSLLDGCAEAGMREVIAVIAASGAGTSVAGASVAGASVAGASVADASIALHARLGFVPAGRLTGVGRKHDRWLDTVLMQCTLRDIARN
jgi:L-amino acid N-acyltransferase YncA